MPTALTRKFRHGLSDGPGGAERVIDSNLQSGIGMRRQYEPGTGTGYGTGMGYGTGASPSPAAPVTPLARVSAPPPPVPGKQVQLAPAARALRPLTPNQGGTITVNSPGGARAVQRIAPSPAADRSPTRPNQGGTMTRNGVTTVVPPSPAAAPVNAPTTVNAQQTESADPLTGDGNAQPEDTTAPVNPGAALGFSRKGDQIPRGSDSVSDVNVGGTGIYARKFNSPKSADLYSNYVKQLFG